jgi:hypothetical protein
MPKTDTSQYKPRLREFLDRKGIEYKERTRRWRCPNPSHADEDPSCTLYNDGDSKANLTCHVCGVTWDIFDVAGLLEGLTEFPDQLKAVQQTLGDTSVKPKPKKNKTKRQPPPPPVALTREKANEVFNAVSLVNSVKKFKWLDGDVRFVKVWPYLNADGLIELFDVRFENEHNKKAVITFYWDGKVMRSAGAPVLLYNRHLIAADTDSPVLIVEGAKAADAAAVIPGFIPITWNGGGKKCKQVDWSVLKERKVYIYPDDDRKKYPDDHRYRPGEYKPDEEQPGIATALDIKKKLPQAKIVKPLEAAREIKPDGADIVEVLEVPEMTPEAVAQHILNGPEITTAPPSPIDTPRETPDNEVFPFRILGVADDGKAYFLDRHERMTSMALGSITQNKLLTLASLTWWAGEYAKHSKGGMMTKDDWVAAVDSVIQIAGSIDFDSDRIRGRGAWRERDGRICYHDGLNTIGQPAPERLYLRITHKSIGIGSPPPDLNALSAILDITGRLSFETRADMIRLLSWATLAPFAGALPWRPAGLLTGRSGVGKSEIVNLIIKPLTMPHLFSGGESTEAGIRQHIGIDAAAIVVDEADTDTEKKKRRRDDVLSLMRQSTSDEAPKVAKGTIDGKGMRFTLRSMFLFAAISPEVESIADDNRLFRVNLEGKGHTPEQWYRLKTELSNAVTPELCASIRSLTWTKLPDIFALAERMSPVIQQITGKSSRFATSESLLFAAYQTIWKQQALTEDNLYEFFEQIYNWQPVEEQRDETEELLDRLLDEVIREGMNNYTLRQVLQKEVKGIGEPEVWAAISGRYGLRVTPDGELAMAKGHHAIMKIIDRGRGYQRIFWRHPLMKQKNKSHAIAGTVRSCVIFDAKILGEGGKEPF